MTLSWCSECEWMARIWLKRAVSFFHSVMWIYVWGNVYLRCAAFWQRVVLFLCEIFLLYRGKLGVNIKWPVSRVSMRWIEVRFQSDIIFSCWLGSKHQLTHSWRMLIQVILKSTGYYPLLSFITLPLCMCRGNHFRFWFQSAVHLAELGVSATASAEEGR